VKTFLQFFLENTHRDSIDIEYFDAIESGNTEKVKHLVDIAAKKSGYNIGPVFHGTPVGKFDKFRVSKSFGPIYFFAKDQTYADYYANRFTGSPSPTTMAVYLRMENPLRLDKFEPEGVMEASRIRKQGYDSVETPNACIVFLPDQIKSANPITYKNNKIIPLSKRFNINSDIINEYRHNLADGTPTPSIQAHNGKNPNILDKKKLHTVGPYQNINMKLTTHGGILTAPEMEELKLNWENGKTINNYKNSGASIQMFVGAGGQPLGRVIIVK